MGGGASCPVPDKKLQDACKAGDLDAGEIFGTCLFVLEGFEDKRRRRTKDIHKSLELYRLFFGTYIVNNI